MKKAAVAFVILMLLPFAVVAADSKTAQAAIDKATADVNELKEKGISTFAASDLLNESETQFGRGNYDRAAELAAQVSALKESAIHASGLLDDIETRMSRLEKEGADTTDARKSFSAANEAFLRDDFATAESLAAEADSKLEEAQAKLGLEKALVTARGFDAKAFLAAYWKETIVVLAVTAVACRYGWKRHARGAAKRKHAKLEAKKQSLFKIMKETQKKHFIDGQLNRMEYLTAMKNYREQMADTNRQLQLLRPGRTAHKKSG